MESQLEDKEAVVKARDGDKDAYRILVQRYQDRAFGVAFSVLRSRADAEDVVQESFVKAYLSLGRFEGKSSFYTWLYRIVYNMAIDYRRKHGKHAQGVELEEEVVARERDVSLGGRTAETPEEHLARRDQRSAIAAGMAELSEEHRTVLTLRELQGLSYEDIAEVTGVNKGTVMSRLHYARKNLQQFLERVARQEEVETEPNRAELSSSKVVQCQMMKREMEMGHWPWRHQI